MFKKILIANRGEIACRVIKTARAMGIQSVAVYSDADRNGLHVQMADEAVHIGAPPASQSYLVIEKIIDACRQTGAEAVHPGYGFLSERAEFCNALTEAGLIFIGPNPNAIGVMGDKIESKKFADDAGVNTVPGHLGEIDTPDEAIRIAEDVGFPVMIKASAGGGGKGMRIAYMADEVAEGFSLAKSEAASSFGDDRVFIEKFIENPRHIEIQVLGDKHGNVIHLGERECSIQRRNQKVVEEAPSPLLDEETRAAMGAQAVALAAAVNYDSAGTVEFVAGQDKSFYFLEMNTRLQVEHPVTELVTGLDLVEHMIRSAAGEPLSLSQDDIKMDGWAIESRLYAEDPFREFLPSIGRLTQYRPPQEGTIDGKTIRNDTGVYEGAEISLYYDPMIAKLVTHAKDRLSAIDHMSSALDRFLVSGIQHNSPFLSALMAHPRWRSGEISTGFISEEYPDGFLRPELDEYTAVIFSAVATSIELVRKNRLDFFKDRTAPHSGDLKREWIVKLGQRQLRVNVTSSNASVPIDLDMIINEGDIVKVASEWRPGETLWQGKIGDIGAAVQVEITEGSVYLSRGGLRVKARALQPHIASLDDLMPEKLPPDTSKMLLCPMPGLVISLHVTAGQEVKAGEKLAVVEAMKMENVLRAERDCIVQSIKVTEGDSLAVDDVIMEFEGAAVL